MKKTALISLVLSSVVLAGCGKFDRTVASLTGSAESCIDGVVYIQFASGVTVKYARDGGIVRCDGSSSTASQGVSSSNSISVSEANSIPK